MTFQPADVLPRVQALLQDKFGLSAQSVQEDSELNSLGIDSLAALEFLFDLEESFNVSLPQDRRDIRTVRDVVNLVVSALSDAPITQ